MASNRSRHNAGALGPRRETGAGCKNIAEGLQAGDAVIAFWKREHFLFFQHISRSGGRERGAKQMNKPQDYSSLRHRAQYEEESCYCC